MELGADRSGLGKREKIPLNSEQQMRKNLRKGGRHLRMLGECKKPGILSYGLQCVLQLFLDLQYIIVPTICLQWAFSLHFGMAAHQILHNDKSLTIAIQGGMLRVFLSKSALTFWIHHQH
jgi:hypothetical protein